MARKLKTKRTKIKRTKPKRTKKIEDLFASVSGYEATTQFIEVLSIPEPDMASTASSMVVGLMNRPVIRVAFERLETKLPDWMRYHVPAHTERVLRYAVALALSDKIKAAEMELLGIAATYHDLGYIESKAQPHEETSAELVEKEMTECGYSEIDINIVKLAILDTRLWPSEDKTTLQQIPQTALGKYLADADLSNFGMDDFFQQSKLVFQEQQFERKGRELTFEEADVDDLLPYLKAVQKFTTNHKWQTKAAKRIFAKAKAKNMRLLNKAIRLLEKVKDGAKISPAFYKIFN